MPLRQLKGDKQLTICCLLGLSHEGGVHIGLLVDNELRLRYNHLNCSAPIQHSISKIIDTRDDCLLMIEIGSTGIASGHGASPDKRGRISWNIGPIVELDDLVARGPYFG